MEYQVLVFIKGSMRNKILLYSDIFFKQLWLSFTLLVLLAIIPINTSPYYYEVALHVYFVSFFFILNPIFVIILLYTRINKRCAFHVGSLMIENVLYLVCAITLSLINIFGYFEPNIYSLKHFMIVYLPSYISVLILYILFDNQLFKLERRINMLINHYCYTHYNK